MAAMTIPPKEHYSWGSTVPRHKLVEPGDLVVFWNKAVLLGASRIASTEAEDNLSAVF